MTSSRDGNESHSVGQVVDSPARAEPRTEPDHGEPSSLEQGSPGEVEAAMPRGRAMRERLLARARQADASHDRRSSLAEEFDAIGLADAGPGLSDFGPSGPAPRRRATRPRIVPRWPALSSQARLIAGTLAGLAAVVSLIVMLRHFDPEPLGEAPDAPRATQVEPTAAATKPAPSPSKPAPPPERQRKRLPGPWRIADVRGQAGLRVVEGQIGREPFLRAVQDAGVPKKQAYRLLIAFKPLLDLDDCGRSDRFVALMDDRLQRLKAFEYVVSKEEVYQAKENAQNLLRSSKLDLKVERQRVQGAFVYAGGKLDDSARQGGFEEGLASALGEALEGHMNLAELERGDAVRLIGQEVTVLGEFSRYAGIEAVEIKRASPDEKGLKVFYFRGSKSRGHYDERGRAPYEGGWRKPIKGAPVTSRFNMKRMHPVLKKIMPHTGTDFGAAAGTPVHASSYGTVAFAGWGGPAGNYVKLKHSGGYETGYAHLTRFADGLKVGDHVKRMQVIGYVGSTGRSTGPHLHFVAKKDGKYIDAESLNLDGMRVLPKDERAEFGAARDEYLAMLAKIPFPDRPDLAPGPELAAQPVELELGKGGGEEAPHSEHDIAAEYDGSGADEAESDTADGEPDEQQATPPGLSAAPASAGVPPAGHGKVYLTDQELIGLQGA